MYAWICCLLRPGVTWRSSVLTLHDGYVHSSPTRARYAAEARPVGDGWTTSAGHEASPAETNTDTDAQTSAHKQIAMSGGYCSQMVLLIL